MTWVIPWSRRTARIKCVDNDDDDHLINGYVCDAAIRAAVFGCPACGRLHNIKATDRQSRVFDQEKQRFRCSSCRFTASVYVIVDVVAAQEKPRRSVVGQCQPSCHVPPLKGVWH